MGINGKYVVHQCTLLSPTPWRFNLGITGGGEARLAEVPQLISTSQWSVLVFLLINDAFQKTNGGVIPDGSLISQCYLVSLASLLLAFIQRRVVLNHRWYSFGLGGIAISCHEWQWTLNWLRDEGFSRRRHRHKCASHSGRGMRAHEKNRAWCQIFISTPRHNLRPPCQLNVISQPSPKCILSDKHSKQNTLIAFCSLIFTPYCSLSKCAFRDSSPVQMAHDSHKSKLCMHKYK